jgi:hypothetical protein
MQTFRNSDSAGIRYSELTPTSVKLYIEEESSGDAETESEAEQVGYLALWTTIDKGDTTDNTYEPPFI